MSKFSKPRLKSRRELTIVHKREVIDRQNSTCLLCLERIRDTRDAEFDHWFESNRMGGDASVDNMVALHRDPCHLTKTRLMDGNVPLHPWQRSCVLRFLEYTSFAPEKDSYFYLAEAFMGSGKSRMALTAFSLWALRHRNAPRDRRPIMIVVAPRKDVLSGWGREAMEMGLSVQARNLPAHDRRVRVNGKMVTIDEAPITPADDCDVYLMTYQGLNSAGNIRTLLRRRPGFLLADEVHRAEDGARWGKALGDLFDAAEARMALSATPFRTSRKAIANLEYGEDGMVQPRYRYSLADARRDNIVCHTEFVAIDAEGIWTVTKDGEPVSNGEDMISSESKKKARRGLRAALGTVEYQDRFLVEASRCQQHVSDNWLDSKALCLVVCSGVKMAFEISERINDREPGTAVCVTASDQDGNPNAEAHRTLEAFKNRETSAHTLVVVDKCVEGFDCPAIKVIAYLTNKITRVRSIQTWGRGMRSMGIPNIECYVVMPAMDDLICYAAELLSYEGESLEDEEDPEEKTIIDIWDTDESIIEFHSDGANAITSTHTISGDTVLAVPKIADSLADKHGVAVSVVSNILRDAGLENGAGNLVPVTEVSSVSDDREPVGQDRDRYRKKVNSLSLDKSFKITGSFDSTGLVQVKAREYANLPSPAKKPLSALSVFELKLLAGDIDERTSGAIHRVTSDDIREMGA